MIRNPTRLTTRKPTRLPSTSGATPLLPGDYPASASIVRFTRDSANVSTGQNVTTSTGFYRIVFPDGVLGEVKADNLVVIIPPTDGIEEFAIFSCDESGTQYGLIESIGLFGYHLITFDGTECNGITAVDLPVNHLTEIIAAGMSSLQHVDISSNQLSESALNAFFTSLPDPGIAEIYCYDNPGADTCDTTIAELKGYTVYTS